MTEVPYGYCECGCGQRTVVSPHTDRHSGFVRGVPRRFLAGHNNWLRSSGHRLEDRGHTTPCWIWQGFINKGGYGNIGGARKAHRVYYERFKGEIPEGHEIDHLCRVTACVNPDHLEAVTPAENRRRSAQARASKPPTEFGAWLQARRHISGLSQQGLSDISGVTQVVISWYERGKIKRPSAAKLAILEAALSAKYDGSVYEYGLSQR